MGDQTTACFETEKTRALLAYLSVEADRPHRRDLLAEMLWPDRPPGAAHANLRHALASLRHSIGDSAGNEAPAPILLATRQTIQLNTDRGVWLDVSAFLKLLATTRPKGQPDLHSLFDQLKNVSFWKINNETTQESQSQRESSVPKDEIAKLFSAAMMLAEASAGKAAA